MSDLDGPMAADPDAPGALEDRRARALQALNLWWEDWGLPVETAPAPDPARRAARPSSGRPSEDFGGDRDGGRRRPDADAESVVGGEARAVAPERRPGPRHGPESNRASGPGSGRAGAPPPRTSEARIEARRLAEAASDLAGLARAMEAFEGCALKATARRFIWPEPPSPLQGGQGGQPNNQQSVLVVAAAPSREADETGEPLAGPQGALLQAMLAAIGLAPGREAASEAGREVGLAFVAPWRPPGDRPPSGDHMAVCAPFLRRRIELQAPGAVLILGALAAEAALGIEDGISRLRGAWRPCADLAGAETGPPALVTHDLASLLRRPALKAQAWEDLLAFKGRLDAPE